MYVILLVTIFCFDFLLFIFVFSCMIFGVGIHCPRSRLRASPGGLGARLDGLFWLSLSKRSTELDSLRRDMYFMERQSGGQRGFAEVDFSRFQADKANPAPGFTGSTGVTA